MTKRPISTIRSSCLSLRSGSQLLSSSRQRREPVLHSYSTEEHRAYSSEAPKLNYAVLSGRALISLDGPDATDFLHNLIPAPVLPLSDSPSCLATAFLNAKGRILHDAFIYKPSRSLNSQQWIIEVDGNSASSLFKHLRKHKLRSKFKLQQLSADEGQVFYLWPRSAVPDEAQAAVYRDPRSKMGSRGLIIGQDAQASLKSMLETHGAKEEYHWEDYMIHRILNGHAEGPIEIPPEHALPQESNLDFYGGIDFQKGCYLGQELTIRTHHTGVVRKRILPVQLYTDEQRIPSDQSRPLYDPLAALPQPPNEANIAKCGAKGRSGRSTGKWLRGYGNIGLALCRLETMTDLSLTAEGSQYEPETDEFEVTWRDELVGEDKAVKARAFVPPWLRQSIEDSIKARSDRSKARRSQKDEDEEDDIE